MAIVDTLVIGLWFMIWENNNFYIDFLLLGLGFEHFVGGAFFYFIKLW